METQFKDIQEELVRATRAWASRDRIDLDRVRQLRDRAILLNHSCYLENIPLYRKIAVGAGYGNEIDIATIKSKLMLSAGIFKSYQQTWLDNRDFNSMTQWLSSLYHRRIEADMSAVTSIDGWIDKLDTVGTHTVYSSGTSGSFSFIARDAEEWKRSKKVNMACLPPLLARRMSTGPLQHLFKSGTKLMSPDALAKLAAKKGLQNYDAVFLAFRQGRMGNQVLIDELAPLFKRCHFLYNIAISGDALRCLQRGPLTDYDRQLVANMKAEVINNKEATYLKLINNIQHSIKEGQKIFIFGAPYQLKELCEVMIERGQCLNLKKGSLVLFGGGWKSLEGQALNRDALIGMICQALNILPANVLEGYSMTEINMLMLRCEHGRFHVPPIIEPVIFDEELNPLAGSKLEGAFGFLDPLACSYPGFVISNDRVRMIDEECNCGLAGPAITEIGRMAGSEIKGCGGIMASMQA